MKNKSIMSKVIAGVMMVGMVISTGTAVFAASATNSTSNPSAIHKLGGNTGMKTQLDTLVTAGTITADQETAVLNLFTRQDNGKAGNHKDGMKTQLDALVTAGTITADQETAIQTALQSSKGDFKTELASLVTAGS
jgi:competence protein ComGC